MLVGPLLDVCAKHTHERTEFDRVRGRERAALRRSRPVRGMLAQVLPHKQSSHMPRMPHAETRAGATVHPIIFHPVACTAAHSLALCVAPTCRGGWR